jgi:hypothetical protein
MDFFTTIKIPKYDFDINYSTPIVFVGSCFSENIGKKLQDVEFNILNNSHGIIYNPVSICNALNECLENKIYTLNDLVLIHDIYHSWQHHGRFGDKNIENILLQINTNIQQCHQFLQNPCTIFITLGSAFAYKLISDQKIVANCHKYPNSNFEKILLSVDEITTTLSATIKQLNTHKIIFTISPVRHWRDGAIENQRSKAHLFTAIHKIIEDFPEQCFYFPAYEIMMDELRDYRFYADDMLHPSPVAIQYIFQKLATAFFRQLQKKKCF